MDDDLKYWQEFSNDKKQKYARFLIKDQEELATIKKVNFDKEMLLHKQ